MMGKVNPFKRFDVIHPARLELDVRYSFALEFFDQLELQRSEMINSYFEDLGKVLYERNWGMVAWTKLKYSKFCYIRNIHVPSELRIALKYFDKFQVDTVFCINSCYKLREFVKLYKAFHQNQYPEFFIDLTKPGSKDEVLKYTASNFYLSAFSDAIYNVGTK